MAHGPNADEVTSVMKLLVITHNVGDPTPFIPDETRRTHELQASGVVEQIYLKADWSGAVFIVESESAEEARRQLSTLPLVSNGMTQLEVIELVPPPVVPY